MRVLVPADQIDHFRRRVIQDAMTSATATYWLRRAEQLETCLPQPGDYPGTATPAETAERVAALRQAIENCRNHARLISGAVAM